MTPKTKLINGKRIDISTGLDYSSPVVQDREFQRFADRNPVLASRAMDRAGYSRMPITTDQLQSVQPYNLNLPRPQVPSSGLESAITGSVNAYKTQSEQERAMREAAQADTRAGLDRSINEIMGLQTEIGDVGNTVDRTTEDTARKEADRYTSEIEAEQLAVRRKIEALQKNPQGMSAGAIADESNRFERESLSKQADLAILQNSALRNYTTAKDIADREVQNKLEPLKIKLENLKFFYAEHKEQSNKEDDRLYSEKIKAEQRAIDKEENLQNQISSIKLEAAKNGAPASVLNKLSTAKTFDEALKLAGSYNMSLSDRIKQAEFSKLSSNDLTPEELKDLPLTLERTADKISTIDSLLGDNVGLAANAGALRSGKILPPGFANKINDWRAKAINVVQKLTVDELGRVKTDGVTFGQLSNGERQAVGDAASALNSAMIYSGKGDDKRPRGSFRMSQDEVKKQFEIIQKYIKLDFERRTGINYDEYQNLTQQKSFQIDPITGNLLLDIPVDDTMFWGTPQ